jgi:hypothetical protein
MTLDSFLELLKSAADVPRQAWAPLAGTLMAWGLTQRLKWLLPAKVDPKVREVATQSFAFAIGLVSTALVWGGGIGWLVGLVVGLWSPALWNVLMLVVGWWKPSLRDALSQDIRKPSA